MRLLIFTETFSPLTETFVYNYILELEQKVQSKVVCLHRINESVFPHSNFEILPQSQGRWKKKINNKLIYYDYSDTAIKNKLDDVIKSFRPDAILSFFINHSLHLVDNLSIYRLPLFIMVLGYDASQLPNISWLYRRKLKSLNQLNFVHFLFVSEALEAILLSHQIKFISSKILPLCVNTKLFTREEWNQADGYRRFIQVSSFNPKKGHQYTLEAFAKFHSLYPTLLFGLTFIGEGPTFQASKQLAKELSISHLTRFLGWKKSSEVKLALEESDVFVHHSVRSDTGDTEGMPTAILEAMSMSLPILSTNHSGIPEAVEQRQNGILVDEQDVTAYVQAIKEVYNWNYLQTNSLKVKANFSLEKQTDILLNMIAEKIK